MRTKDQTSITMSRDEFLRCVRAGVTIVYPTAIGAKDIDYKEAWDEDDHWVTVTYTPLPGGQG